MPSSDNSAELDAFLTTVKRFVRASKRSFQCPGNSNQPDGFLRSIQGRMRRCQAV